MIDPKAFAYWMSVIADRNNRALAQGTCDAYYDALSRHLTTEEFVVAARLVFETETFWVQPQVFVDKVRPSAGPTALTVEANEAFGKVSAITARPGGTTAVRSELGEVALRAYLAVGGYARFKGLLEADEKWVRKEFVEAYADAWKLAARETEIAQLRAEETKARLAAGKEPKHLSAPQSLGSILNDVRATAATKAAS